MTESAIPQHLRCPRTRQPRASAESAPPYPAWVARFQPQHKQMAMAYYGIQYQQPEQRAEALAVLRNLVAQFELGSGPQHHDIASCQDAAGYHTLIAVAYWDESSAFDAWRKTEAIHQWWMALENTAPRLGFFREAYAPRSSHLETLFSTPDKFEGMAELAMGRSGEIQEHGYWGSARDRLPASQTDAFVPSGKLAARRVSPTRVLVAGHGNVALIRSGQDWSETTGKERALYLEQVEPVLRQGMDFLRDQGASIGCYFNRYMEHTGLDGQRQEKSYGLSAWRSLEHMERWAESHPTHVAIFGTFMSMVQALDFQLQLRLYHEVTILGPDEQQFEYVNCHPKTGFLAVAAE